MSLLNKKIKILVVDDHPIVYEGLEMLFSREKDFELCGAAESATNAMNLIRKIKPELVIVDISLKGGVNGIELIKAIKERHPMIKILVLSMHDEALYAERSFKAGASGYVKKEELTNAIIKAIRSVMDGRIFLSEKISSENNFLPSVPSDHLTPREIEVIELLGQGYRTCDIAGKMNLSARTIDTHRQHIRKKLNLKSSAELIKYAVELVHNTASK